MEEADRILKNHNPEEPLFLYFAHQVQHVPLQSPPDGYNETSCAHINKTLPDGADRHTLCTMTSRLDKAIGDFVSMLIARGMWNNTVMWVTADK